MGENWKIGKHG